MSTRSERLTQTASRLRSRCVLALTVALSIGLGTGTALAYWRTTGTGSGTASVGTVSNVTVVAVTTGTPSSKLIPGGTADLLIRISNQNSYAVTLVTISQNGTKNATGCSNAAAAVTVPTQNGLTVNIPAGTNDIHVPASIAMSNAAASGCQSQTLHVPVLITAQK